MKTVPGTVNNNPPPGGGGSGNLPPAITPVGIPVGDQVTKTIGPAGGSIVSDDSVVEVKIPAGALPSNTDISIQSITNETPGGIGLSYRLGPDGQKFLTPVTLIFHYADDEIDAADPYALFVAYQDSLNEWMADLKNRDVDSIAKTVTLDIPHFSAWAIGQIGIKADRTVLMQNETSTIIAYKVIDASDPSDLAATPIAQPVPMDDNKVTNWAVDGRNGGASDRGTITPGNGYLATYTAPASIPVRKTVRVTAEYNDVVFTRWNRRSMVFSNQHATLGTNIVLVPSEYNFTIQISYNEFGPVYSNQTYYDHATFDLNIKIKNDHQAEATMLNTAVNYPPSVTPVEVRYDLGQGIWVDWTWIPDQVGYINITGASAFDNNGISYNSEKNSVRILLIHQGALIPKYDYKDSNGLTQTVGGQNSDGIPDSFDINLTTGKQTTFRPDGNIKVNLIRK